MFTCPLMFSTGALKTETQAQAIPVALSAKLHILLRVLVNPASIAINRQNFARIN
jgi:hypothetical protein